MDVLAFKEWVDQFDKSQKPETDETALYGCQGP